MTAALSLRSIVRLSAAGAILLGLAACGGSGGIGEDDDAAAHLRAVNLITDSPAVQFSVDGTAVFSADYAGMTAYNGVHVRTSTLQLSVPSPSDLTGAATTFTNIGSGVQQIFAQDKDYTLFAYGTVAAPQLFAVEGTNQRAGVADNKVIWQIVHAAPGVGSVDVYLTAPEAGVNIPTFISNLNLQQSTTAPELTLTSTATTALSVNMTLELRQPGSPTVLYRSKAIAVNEQSRLLFAIVDSQGPGPAPLELIALSGTVATPGTRQVDAADNAEVRFAHLSVDAPALDLIRGPTLTNTLATNIAFGAASTHQSVPNGTLDTIGVETGDTSSFLFLNNLSAAAGTSYTLYAIGPLADIDGQVLVDSRRAVATLAQFRFLNAASSLAVGDTLSVYLTSPGAGLTLTGSSPPTANVSSLAYRAASGYLSLKDGSYDVYFALTGATTTLLGPVTIQLTLGSVKTFVLANGAGGALTLVPFDDV